MVTVLWMPSDIWIFIPEQLVQEQKVSDMFCLALNDYKVHQTYF